MNYSDFRTSVRTALGDQSETSHPDDLILDGVRAGLVALAKTLPDKKIISVSCDGESTLALPEQVHRIESVINSTQDVVYDKFDLNPMMQYSGHGPMWMEVSAGLYFADPPANGDALVVIADGYWEEPVLGEDVLSVPDKALNALRLYIMAYCLNPDVVKAANLRQYNTKVDSGNPEDSPHMEAAKFLLTLFDAEASRIGVF